MNELKYSGLTVEERVVVYFELAKDATLASTEEAMITAAIALMLLLNCANVDKKAVAERLRKEAKRCNITATAVFTTIDLIERG